MTRQGSNRLPAVVFVAAAAIACVGLGGCDKETSSSKKTTTQTTETPQGTKKTTETTERKVEVDPK